MSRAGNRFTLVEIMIVVAIIGLLAAVAIPSFVMARNGARKNICITNLREIQAAQAQLAFNLADGAALERSSVNNYLRHPDPVCPATGEQYDLTQMPPECPSVADHPDHTLGQ